MQEFKEIDIRILKNIKVALQTGRFEITGIEAIELAKMMDWCDQVNDLIIWQLKNPRPVQVKPKPVTAAAKKTGTRSTRKAKKK
jgi:hypothetical protein